MGSYNPDDYVGAAAALPAELLAELGSTVGQSGEEYLAQADAAADASLVAVDLAQSMTVLGSRLEGTTLVVNVADPADVAEVVATGAVAEVNAPPAPELDTSSAQLVQNIDGGEAYYFEGQGAEEGARCSIGFNGYVLSSGANEFASAGHCIFSTVANGGNFEWITQTAANTNFAIPANAVLGQPVAGSHRLGGGYDVGLVKIDMSAPRAWTPRPRVTTWNGGAGAPTTSVAVTDSIPGVVGATMCKSGSTSGWSCGKVAYVDIDANIGGTHINSVVSTMCMQPGDSGGAAMIGTAAVGINSWSFSDVPCGDPDYYSGVFPLLSWNTNAATVSKVHGDKWEPSVTVGALTVTPASTMTGTVAQGNANQRVQVFIDGALNARTAIVTSNGSWTLPLTDLAAGTHSFSAVARWGSWSKSATVSGSFNTPFADVGRDDLFAAEMNWMFSSGISTGYLDGNVRTYRPLEDVSRQAMAAFLYRAANSPAFTAPATPSFTDVPTSNTFYKQIEWMKSTGITVGNVAPGGTFTYNPEETVSRQAMSAFLYRAAGSPPFTTPSQASFTDVPLDHPFSAAVEWMKAEAITSGYQEGSTWTYHPLEGVSRRAMAAFLYRAAN